VDPAQHRSREPCLEPIRQQQAKSAEAQRPGDDTLDAKAWIELDARPGSPREQDGDRLLHGATERDRERDRRGGIHPLGVVDGDEERFLTCEGPQRRQQSDSDGARPDGRAARLLEEQRARERLPLWRGKTADLLLDVREQIPHRRERQLALRLCGACDEHAESVLAGLFDAC
jgi:hypothetical protein